MMGAENRLGMPAQRLGLVGGALNHLHGETRAGAVQGRRPGRRGAIRGVLLQQNEVRHRLDGHPADPRMKGFVLAHRHPARRHALGERLALLIGHRDHGRFQGGIEGVLRAVARTDEGRQSAELQEFTHQPSSARRPQRHREVRRRTSRCNHDTPSGVRANAVKAAGGSPRGAPLHHACRVLRGTPRSAATPRCVSPAARRASATAMCSACSKRVRRVMTRYPRPGLECPGRAAPALGLGSISAGLSSILPNPR